MKRKQYPRYSYLQSFSQSLSQTTATVERQIRTVDEFLYFSAETGLWKRKYPSNVETRRKTLPFIITPEALNYLKHILKHVYAKFVHVLQSKPTNNKIANDILTLQTKLLSTQDIIFVAQLGQVEDEKKITNTDVDLHVLSYVYELDTPYVNNLLYLYVPSSGCVDQESPNILRYKDEQLDIKWTRREVWKLDVEQVLHSLLNGATELDELNKRVVVLMMHSVVMEMFFYSIMLSSIAPNQKYLTLKPSMLARYLGNLNKRYVLMWLEGLQFNEMKATSFL
jgi:hypothetical protein